MKARPAARLSMALCLCVWVSAQAASTQSAQIALDAVWRDEATGGLAWRRFDASGKTLEHAVSPYPPAVHGAAPPQALEQKVPLGSLWKLFVYLWLAETRADAPPYVNTGVKSLREEESYCGEPGDSIGRDAALVSSCGLFFDPARLRIAPETWRAFWQPRLASGVAPWLPDLAAMRPETEVTPAALIAALEAAPPRAREEAASILLARAFLRGSDAYPADAWVRHAGGGWRVKTFSWFRPGSDKKIRFGGGAGWLADGTPVWFGGHGTGQGVMARFGAPLAAALPAPSVSLAPGCVKVRLFARYPLTRVERAGGQPASPGSLRGDHVARFESGVALPFRANGEIRLTMDRDQVRLDARLGLDDYVARVLDREADAGETEAARALSVVVRSYLLNEARQEGNCLSIDDSSRKQRVSPNPPSAAARAVAGFTTGLTLAGSPVGYHGVTPAKNRMSWTEAVSAARAGKSWTDLLVLNFPEAELRAMRDPAGLDCQSFAAAERWLAGHAPRWQRVLRERLPGFEAPEPPRICLLRRGNPFSEQDRNRIHIRALRTLDDRVTLAHEYLHLGLRHPARLDEALVERWARELAGLAGGLYE
ncbi:MAG: DUF2300 domain-containing protein [Candidatus Accumulibacter sp.]|jgi:uncharacterized protein YfaQ (DUF2300 family)|nr:DUF2300 domain-containing protein [Accumulibacter sp.]